MTGNPASRDSDLPRQSAGQRWLFGPAILDERSLELTVHGKPSALERKSLEVLLHLLGHAGEVVTKEELLEAVWPGRVVTENSLTKCLGRIRAALGDEAQALIKTVHGYGYRVVAPVRVESSAAPASPAFAFKPGDHPPLRPHWSLVENLGRGGHGEVWLARHDKTREQRVFKFAVDGAALASLKREITLYRLLHDSLGDKAPVVRILDWNLEQEPCFIESEYVAAGSLSDWAGKAGGIAQVPLATRLEVVAQVAEALSAAHSVGVLHKDLKPSNVLIGIQADGKPKARLCDFGSGGVLDRKRLESIGITQLGFTKTADVPTSGTQLYAAPEVLGGQPPTTRSDVYALGVLLYQVVVGDLKRAPVPGWERDVPDELLREDIAAACEGDARFRIVDAEGLARRIRLLEVRRESRAAEKPETRYTSGRSGGDRVAYQVLGDGPLDLVFTQGTFCYMETQSVDPAAASFFRRLATGARMIRFDRRGWGLSDPPSDPDTPLPERWLQDFLAVLDTVGARRPVIIATADGGPLVTQFVHRHPERCAGLILCNTAACFLAKPDYPEGHSPEFLRAMAEGMQRTWGRPEGVAYSVQSRAHDKEFLAWFAREQRLIARPNMVAENMAMFAQWDVRSLLPSIRVPTLVMTRENFAAAPPALARYLADHIAGARFVLLPGSDISLYWETPDLILERIREFLAQLKPPTT